MLVLDHGVQPCNADTKHARHTCTAGYVCHGLIHTTRYCCATVPQLLPIAPGEPPAEPHQPFSPLPGVMTLSALRCARSDAKLAVFWRSESLFCAHHARRAARSASLPAASQTVKRAGEANRTVADRARGTFFGARVCFTSPEVWLRDPAEVLGAAPPHSSTAHTQDNAVLGPVAWGGVFQVVRTASGLFLPACAEALPFPRLTSLGPRLAAAPVHLVYRGIVKVC